jgi:homoserine kinase
MEPASVNVFAPASISNIGPGFDVLGLAIDAPGDNVIARRTRDAGISFSVRTAIDGVPKNPKQNVCAFVASLLLTKLNPRFGIALTLEKRMPIGSGLGSSAASSVAAAVAVNALLGKPLAKEELLPFILEGEKKASGSAHADNAAPSLLGGLCLIRSYAPLDVVRLPVSRSIVWVVVHPHMSVETRRARRLLPERVPLRDAVRQWGNVSGLTAGLMSGNFLLIRKSIEDIIVEPVRAKLIPGFEDVRTAALRAGAFGCSISGSGPSVFAVAESVASARRIGSAMKAAFARKAKVRSDLFISRVNTAGARIVR